MQLILKHIAQQQACLKKGRSPLCRTHKRWAEFKLHTVVDQDGKPLCLLLSEGEMSDYKGAALLLSVLLEAQELITDKGIDTDWFTQVLFDRKIKPCIPPRKARTANIYFDKATYTLRHKIENLFAKLQTWRRIATRYDPCAHTFFSAICIAATDIFYLN